MKIEMTKRQGGIYAQWYVIEGLDKRGRRCTFLIFPWQARTYAQAVRYWNNHWAKDNKAFVLKNAEPFSDYLWQCC